MSAQAPWKLVCLILAMLLFGLSAWAASWTAPQDYWNGRFIAAGLFFYTLSILLTS
jgi:hypothetical protein